MIVEQQSGVQGKQDAEFGSQPQPPIIYFNIGWMERYAGLSSDDETKGNHGYLKDHRHGGEAFNFAKSETGTMRGYRPPGDREKTHIDKMGAAKHADQVDCALVVWLAKEPASDRALIVGWYCNATVFRVARDSGIDLDDERVHYSAEASVDDVVLLSPLMRTFQVQSSRTRPGAGFGQKPTWYGAEEVDELVWAYIRKYRFERQVPPSPAQPNPPKNFDPELRRKVEKAAIDHAIDYYRELYGPQCVVESVEACSCGWDLEVFVDSKPLLVEVKGLLNSGLVCELTPNEYEKMMLLEHRPRYIIYVVNNALAEWPAVPVASIFKHAGQEEWVTDDGRTLCVTPKVGAVLSCP